MEVTRFVYAHLFAQARHADDIRHRIAESEFGRVLEREGCGPRLS